MHKPFKTNAENVRKFLTRPYKDIEALVTALQKAAKVRPDGSFCGDQISTLAMSIAAKNVMEAFVRAYDPGEQIDLLGDACNKPYNETDEVTRKTIINAFIPLLSAAVKAFHDVDMLTHSLDKIAKTMCDARDQHERDGEPYSEDFLSVAKAVTKVMKPLVGAITHDGLTPDEESDDCDCPACELRRAVKKAGGKPVATKQPISMEVEHLKLELNPNKPETWEAEISKLNIPDEVKKMILAQVRQEHGDEAKPSPKMPPPTGFNVDFRRN